jgi:comEA protein
VKDKLFFAAVTLIFAAFCTALITLPDNTVTYLHIVPRETAPVAAEVKETSRVEYETIAETVFIPSADTPVNINTADLDRLCALPGIGPALAERIVQYRNESGDFMSPEEIMNVRGIGEAMYEKIKDMIIS